MLTTELPASTQMDKPKGGQGFQYTIFHSRILSPRIPAGQRGLSLAVFTMAPA